MKHTLRTHIRLLAILLLCSPLATIRLHAQSAALGGIGGVVRDTTGAVVAGATVVVSNPATGFSRTLTTDGEGHYQLQFLQPGTYEVVLGGNGSFGKVDRKGVAVTVGAPITVDAELPTANVSTEVTVSSEAPLIDTEKVEESQVVDQAVVSNVPVNSRRFESFVLLTPNVVPDGNTGLIGYRGVSGVYNQNIIDGANNNQQFFSEARGRSIGAPYVWPVDAIREFESSATGYSAELGGAAGGIINAITKSGTNEWHGDAYEYYRTPGWNALDPLNKYQGRLTNNHFLLTQPVKVQHQFGVSIGGPIIRDKFFFHFSYDGYRRANPITYLSTYNSTSTNVASLVHLCDGGTVHLVDGSTSYPTSIPNVSPTQCTAAVAAVQSNLGAFPRNTTQDIFFPRLDYQLGSKTHLSGEFLWQNYNQPNGYNTSTTINNGGQSQNGTASFHERIIIANAETALSPNSANVVHFQWGRDLETASTNQGGPANNLTNLFSYGETSALPRGAFPDEHKWQISDVYSHMLGHHTVKAGFDAFFVHEQIANLFGGGGAFNYSNGTVEINFANWIQDQLGVNPTYTYTSASTAPMAGTLRHFVSFSQTVDQLTGVGADNFWNQNLDFFAEDQWKATPKFLLSLGLRYDVQLVPGPDRPNTLNPVAFNATSQINPNLQMIQPRVGFNWNPQTGTVVRGGYGMFYGQIGNSSYYTLRRENGVYQKQYADSAPVANLPYVASGVPLGPTYTGQPTASQTKCVPVAPATVCYNNNGQYHSYGPQGGVPIYTPPGPAPFNYVTGQPITIPSSINPALGTGITIRGMDPSFTNPVSQSWDLTVEQALPLHSSFTLGYVGNRANHLPIYIDTNVDPASVLNNRFYAYTNPVTGATGTAIQPTFVNKLYASTGTVATGFSAVNSWYHSMVVTVRKPMARGVELLANYTWAHAMDGGQTYGTNGTFNGTDAPLVPLFTGGRSGIGDEYARSDLDIRGRAVVTLVGRSNFTLGNKFAEYATNGWLLSGTYTAQSGEPVTATVSGSYTSISGGALGTPGLAITTDAGPANASFTSGPSARVPDFIAKRNAFAGPGVHNLDARLSRTFSIKERYSFELAAEAFNLANHRNILSVNTNLVQYTAAAGSGTGPCVLGTAATGGCNGTLGPLPSSAAQFMTPSSTSNIIYGPRQIQLLGRFIF
ncbi:MAG TPA: carboxypeptidase regulatory-like domain-containing protein [Bryocella sp.]|nr:carboxypeptidase regulatory-like domain-containing protein [Bryocella sp.]